MGLIKWFRRRLRPPAATQSQQDAKPLKSLLEDLQLAEKIYANDPPWLYETTPAMEGSGVGAVAAMEIARLITLESKFEVMGDSILDDVLQRYVVRNIRAETEKGWALGGLIMKPYFVGATVSAAADGSVQTISGNMKVEFCYPGQFMIHGYEITGAVFDISFYTKHKKGSYYYVLVERQTFDEAVKTTTITNTVYRMAQAPKTYLWDNLGSDKVPLSTVEKWANLLPQYVFNDVAGVLCGFYRPPGSNNTDLESPYGKSPLTRARNAIRDVDRSKNQLAWEMKSTLAKLYIDEVAYDQGKGVPKNIEGYYVRLLGNPDKKLFEMFNPAIRQESYLQVYDSHLKQLEDAVGLAHGTLSQPPENSRTATEIRMSKQRTFATVKDNQAALKECINQLVYAMAVWSYPGKDISGISVNYFFDDSVLSDPLEQLEAFLQMQGAGNIPKWYTNEVCLGKTEEEAKKLVAEARDELASDISEDARYYPGLDPIYARKGDANADAT